MSYYRAFIDLHLSTWTNVQLEVKQLANICFINERVWFICRKIRKKNSELQGFYLITR